MMNGEISIHHYSSNIQHLNKCACIQTDDSHLKSPYDCLKNMRQKLLFTLGLISMAMVCHSTLQAQNLKKEARLVRSALTELNLESFISLYADTVHYVDPNYGADNYFPKATVRQFFEPLFAEGSSFDLKLHTVAIDDVEKSIMIRGDAYDQTEKGRLPWVVFLRFENGKIVHQIDFPVYAIESLRAAPRYKGYFKEKGG